MFPPPKDGLGAKKAFKVSKSIKKSRDRSKSVFQGDIKNQIAKLPIPGDLNRAKTKLLENKLRRQITTESHAASINHQLKTCQQTGLASVSTLSSQFKIERPKPEISQPPPPPIEFLPTVNRGLSGYSNNLPNNMQQSSESLSSAWRGMLQLPVSDEAKYAASLKYCSRFTEFFDISIGRISNLIIIFQIGFIVERLAELLCGASSWLWPLVLNSLGLIYMLLSTRVNPSSSEINLLLARTFKEIEDESSLIFILLLGTHPQWVYISDMLCLAYFATGHQKPTNSYLFIVGSAIVRGLFVLSRPNPLAQLGALVIGLQIQQHLEHNKVSKSTLESQIDAIKLDYEGIMQHLPKGFVIYQLDEGAVKVKFINAEFLKVIAGPDASQEFSPIFQEPSFRYINFKDGEQRINSKQVLSLNQIMRLYRPSAEDETQIYFSKEAVSEDDDLGSLISDQSQRKDLLTIEMTIKKGIFENQPVFILTASDISQIIANQNQKLKSHYQDAVTATVSHEQMNPLNSIINLSELLIKQSAHLVSPDMKMLSVPRAVIEKWNRMACILNSSSIQIQLVNSAMLSHTLIKQKKFSYSPQTVDSPFGLLNELADLFKEHCSKKQICFEVDDRLRGDQGIVELVSRQGVSVDPHFFKQIFFHICSNAVKYSTSGGTISLFAKAKKEAYQPERAFSLIVFVRDTGEGMSPSTKKNLFLLFNQLGKKAQIAQGHGLGLYLSNQLASFLDGQIKVESEQGKGTTVAVSLEVELGNKDENNIFLRQPLIEEESATSRSSISQFSRIRQHRRNIMQQSQSSNSGNEFKADEEFSRIVKQQQNNVSPSKRATMLSLQSSSFKISDHSHFSKFVAKHGNSPSSSSATSFESSSFSEETIEQMASLESDSQKQLPLQVTHLRVDKLGSAGVSPNSSYRKTQILSDICQVTLSEESVGLDDNPYLIETQIKTKHLLDNEGDDDDEEVQLVNSSSSRYEHPNSQLSAIQQASKESETEIESHSSFDKSSSQLSTKRAAEDSQHSDGILRSNHTLSRHQMARNSLLQVDQSNVYAYEKRASMRTKDFDVFGLKQKAAELQPSDTNSVMSALTFKQPTNQLKDRKSFCSITMANKVKEETNSYCECAGSSILIIEDNIFNSETLKLMIKDKFLTDPDVAYDGREGLQMFTQKMTNRTKFMCSNMNCPAKFYGLIFMDLNMPVMDGLEATSRILQLQESLISQGKLARREACSIVALTAFLNRENIERCEALGMEDLLNKPASMAQVNEKIKQFCPYLPERTGEMDFDI